MTSGYRSLAMTSAASGPSSGGMSRKRGFIGSLTKGCQMAAIGLETVTNQGGITRRVP